MAHYIFFGNSITQGFWDTQGGWVQRFRTYLDKRYLKSNKRKFQIVFNQGVSGDTMVGVLKRFDQETKSRLSSGENILVICVGTNDSIWIKSKNRFKTSPSVFRKNLQTLINKAKNYTPKVILIGGTPVVEKLVNPMPWSTDEYLKNTNIESSEKTLKEICKTNDVPFIDLYTKFKKVDYESLLEDGDHPNNKGHQKIFQIVKSYMERHNLI